MLGKLPTHNFVSSQLLLNYHRNLLSTLILVTSEPFMYITYVTT